MSDDLVRVRYQRNFTDGLAGTAFVDGVSLPISRIRAARIVAGLGNGARILESGEEAWPSAAPVAPALAALPTEPAPDDAPAVSPAHVARPAPSASLPQHHPRRR